MLELSVVFAGLFFAWGAFVIMTARDSEAQVTKGREIATTAVYGAVIALGAWLIIGTVMQIISGSSSKLPWSEINCVIERTSVAPAQATQTAGKNSTAASPPSPQNAALSEQEIRKQLEQAGITVNKNACPAGTAYQNVSGGCTSLEGVQSSTMTAAVQLKQSCNCSIEITGGTELGHAAGPTSHAGGYKLDFSLNPALDQYVQKLDYIGARSDGVQQYRAANGTVFAKEGDHWDVTFSK